MEMTQSNAPEARAQRVRVRDGTVRVLSEMRRLVLEARGKLEEGRTLHRSGSLWAAGYCAGAVDFASMAVAVAPSDVWSDPEEREDRAADGTDAAVAAAVTAHADTNRIKGRAAEVAEEAAALRERIYAETARYNPLPEGSG